jgi:hypothetical protein
MFKNYFIIIVLLVTCLNANARDYYAGINIGTKQHDIGVTLISSTFGDKDSGTLEIMVGSKINNSFSIEASYINFGDAFINSTVENSQFTKNGYTYVSQDNLADQTNVKYEVDAVLIGTKYNVYSETTSLGVGNIYLSGGVSFWSSDLGTSGYTKYGHGVAFNDRVLVGNVSDSGITPFFGIGYDWTINNRINLHFDITGYEIDGDTSAGLAMGINLLSF